MRADPGRQPRPFARRGGRSSGHRLRGRIAGPIRGCTWAGRGEAGDIARRTDHLNMQASALLAFADVLAIEGRPAQAIPIIEEARVLYDRKGNVVMAEQARTLLAEL